MIYSSITLFSVISASTCNLERIRPKHFGWDCLRRSRAYANDQRLLQRLLVDEPWRCHRCRGSGCFAGSDIAQARGKLSPRRTSDSSCQKSELGCRWTRYACELGSQRSSRSRSSGSWIAKLRWICASLLWWTHEGYCLFISASSFMIYFLPIPFSILGRELHEFDELHGSKGCSAFAKNLSKR